DPKAPPFLRWRSGRTGLFVESQFDRTDELLGTSLRGGRVVRVLSRNPNPVLIEAAPVLHLAGADEHVRSQNVVQSGRIHDLNHPDSEPVLRRREPGRGT